MTQDIDPRDEIVGHLPAMRAYALGLTRNPAAADDLVQDTVVKAWTRIETFAPGTNLRAWLFTILRNTFLSGLRKNRRERLRAEEPHEGFALPAHDGPLAMRDFLRAFGSLSAEHREVLTLIGVLGVPYAEAARTLGVLPGTVKSRVNRARRRLMILLGLSGDETIMPTPEPYATAGLLAHAGADGR